MPVPRRSTSATRRAPTRRPGRRRPRSRRPATRSPSCSAPARRGRVHRRRHRGRQPRGEGRGPPAHRGRRAGDGVVTTAFEHKGVLAAAHRLERRGLPGRPRLAVTPPGVVDLDDLAARRDDAGTARRVGHARQQRGRHDPAARRGRRARVRARAPEALLHTDAVQAVPWLDVATLAADGRPRRDLGATSSAARRASACSWCATASRSSRRSRAAARSAGCAPGTVERRRRGRDGRRAAGHRDERAADVARIARPARPAASTGCSRAVPDAFENGDRARARSRATAHVGFRGRRERGAARAARRGRACARRPASSCSSGATEPSHVLAAMGMPAPTAPSASIRLSLGYASTDADVDLALAVIPRRGRAAPRAPARRQ